MVTELADMCVRVLLDSLGRGARLGWMSVGRRRVGMEDSVRMAGIGIRARVLLDSREWCAR